MLGRDGGVGRQRGAAPIALARQENDAVHCEEDARDDRLAEDDPQAAPEEQADAPTRMVARMIIQASF